MSGVDFKQLVAAMKGRTVERPNKADSGTLSGHAAGEPFEKCVYHYLKELYPDKIFKQYEYLNQLYLANPDKVTAKDRFALLKSPAVRLLLTRGADATKGWSKTKMFVEKQNDTADILYHDSDFYDIIDVKTRNMGKEAMPPNIISASKVAEMCALMLENGEYDNLNIDYIEIDWVEEQGKLKCVGAHHADLFKVNPNKIRINWAAAMQIQFHVCDIDQSWTQSKEEWAREYLKVFMKSAEHRRERMKKNYITPYQKYIQDPVNQDAKGE